jgi:hypothetical protein
MHVHARPIPPGGFPHSKTYLEMETREREKGGGRGRGGMCLLPCQHVRPRVYRFLCASTGTLRIAPYVPKKREED